MTMLPTRDQIERAAYDRWLRRHRAHGYDRADWIGAEQELTYRVNYEAVVEHVLDNSHRMIVGADGPRRCRFCERTARYATFSAPRAILQGVADSPLWSVEVCDECEADCRGSLVASCEIFWKTVGTSTTNPVVLVRNIDALAVYKSLVMSALLMMPEPELAYFSDTLEWTNNPDHDYDAQLFAGTHCHLYHAPFWNQRSWVSLARRIEDDAPCPYMVAFFSSGGVVVQISVPLSIRDHDLDGRVARLPARSLTAGEGADFRVADATVLKLGHQPKRERPATLRALLVA